MGNGQSTAEITNVVTELSTRDVTIAEVDLWSKILLTPFTQNDLNNVMHATDLRRMRQYHPCSLASLIYCAVEQLDIYTTSKCKIPRSEKGFNVIQFSYSTEKAADDNMNKEPEVTYETAVNCVLLIAKVMPFALEQDIIRVSKEPRPLLGGVGTPILTEPYPELNTYAEDFAHHVLSKNRTLAPVATSENGGENTTEDCDTHMFPIDVPLATLMVNALVRAAMTPNFTIGNHQKPVDAEGTEFNLDFVVVDSSVLWSAGVGGSPRESVTKAHWAISNRRYVLSAIVATLTSQIFIDEALEPDLLFRSVYTDIKLCPLTPTLVASMLNTIGNYNAFGSLPFSSHLTDEIEELVLECAEVLSLLADTSTLPSIIDKMNGGDNNNNNTAESNNDNHILSRSQNGDVGVTDCDHLNKHTVWGVFRAMSHKESLFIFRSIVKLVSTRSHSKTSTLHIQRALPRYDGLLILLFRLIDHCPSFFSLISQDETILILIVPLLDYIDEVTVNGARISQAQLGMFILMRLSSSRNFAVLCNEKVKERLSFHLRHFDGSYNDLLVMSMYKWIGTRQDENTTKVNNATKPKASKEGGSKALKAANGTNSPPYGLISLHETCAIIITNMSPYMTSIALPTAFQLVAALETMTRPKWLSLHQSYPNILLLTVESIANIIQYQFAGCATLIYSLSRFKSLVMAVYDALEGASANAAENNNNNNNTDDNNNNTDNNNNNDDDNNENTEKEQNASDETTHTIEEEEEDFSMSLPSTQIDGSVVQPTDLGNQYQEKKYQFLKRIADLSGDKYIPKKIKRRIQISTLKCAVELAEPVMVKAIQGCNASELIRMIENSTFVGAMPAPHHIIVRKFDSHEATDSWLVAVLWGVVFTSSRFYDGKAIKLFKLH